MISDGAFSIFKRFSASEKPFHAMPMEENDDFWGRGKESSMKFNSSMRSRVQLVQRSSISVQFFK
jgi:deferrochelatase/peroxidase EfeB